MAEALARRAELLPLVARLARLTHRRYRTFARLREAHALLRWHARQHGYDLVWCDRVMLLMLDEPLGRIGPDEIDLAHPPA